MVATALGLWDGFILPENCDQTIASERLNEYCDALMSQELNNALSCALETAKQEIERTGGDWAVSGPSVENMLENFRRCVRSSMVPDEVLNRMPIPMM